MKAIWVALAAAMIWTCPSPAKAAAEGPWCAFIGIGHDSMIEKCDMMSFEQCRAEIAGMGSNHCAPNPRYRAKSSELKRRKAQKSRDR
jgi:hypothetical protein